jgi:hypothetical protein
MTLALEAIPDFGHYPQLSLDVSQARLTPLVETSSSAVGILPDTLELIPNPIHVQSMHQDYSRNLSVV